MILTITQSSQLKRIFKIAHSKGLIAEEIVRSHLEQRGWVVYKPITNMSHGFDFIATKDWTNAIALDIKAKARMNKYPATGIDLCYYRSYKTFSEKYNMPFWVVFCDELSRTIYGNTLTELDKSRVVDGKSYPIDLGSIRIWPINAMIHIANLTEYQSVELQKLNQRNYSFDH